MSAFDARRAVLVALLAVALWMVGRPYEGMGYDAQLYALQALAKLHPISLGHDVFLRFGSQDDYTLFSPVYATVINWLGVENAARYLTLVGQVWWLAALASLAIVVLGFRRGWLAASIVAAMPGYYGAFEVFRFAEPFLTPRLFAEASVLTGLAVTLAGRRWIGGLFMISAAALHPLMAMGGLLVWAGVVACDGLRRLLAAGVLGGALLAVATALFLPVYPLAQFDPAWLELIRARSSFLFLQDWTAAAWEGTVFTIVSIWILGSATATGRARRLLLTSTVVGLLGLIVTGLGSAFDVVLLIQGQAWRWTWLACALFGLALVAGLPGAWRQGPVARAAVLLLGVGWLMSGWESVVPSLMAASSWVMRRRIGDRPGRMFASVALVLLGLAIILRFWSLPLWGPSDSPGGKTGSTWHAVRQLLADGVLGSLLVLAVWSIVQRVRRLASLFVVTGSLVAVAAVATAPDWSRVDYTTPDEVQLAIWKQIIPEDAEVLWPGNNVAPWLLLKRRNYMSTNQTAGIVFSREATMEMLRRAQELVLVQGPSMAFGPGLLGGFWQLNSKSLIDTCTRSRVDFIVLQDRLAVQVESAPLRVRDRSSGVPSNLYLYSCGRLRDPLSQEEPGR